MDLTNRQKEILKAVVESYIESGEPVGSKTLVDRLKFQVSSATVRNELSELDGKGFLEQPHTSAGRIPTDEGYRVYVNSLMNRYKLTIEEIGLINHLLDGKVNELGVIVDEAARVLSEMTNYTAVSVKGKPKTGKITRFETVFVNANSFLLIMITSVGVVKTRHVYTKYNINYDVLDFITEILNRYLADRDIADITVPSILELEEKMGEYRGIISPVLRVVYEVVREINKYEVQIDGISHILQYPEYADITKARSLMSVIEEKSRLVDLLVNGASNDLNVYIGDENGLDEMGGTSFVFHTFKVGNQVVGGIGLIGPRRMDYAKVIARLEYFAGNLLGEEMPEDKKPFNQ